MSEARSQSEQIQQAADLLRRARHGTALTGAGISTPSGIPDFRSADSGVWEQVDPYEVGSIDGFRRNPNAFYEWHRPLARTILEAKPNAAHLALTELEEKGKLHSVVTQNIDLLHERAGSSKVYEVHGHLRTATCVDCHTPYDGLPLLDAFVQRGEIPTCANCGGLVKPDIILFGEILPLDILEAAQREMMRCDVLIVAGCSLVVAPVSQMPYTALNNGASLIVINYEETPVDKSASVVLHGDVAELLPQIVELV